MKITKASLKRIIREEYSRLKSEGLIVEFGEKDSALRQKIQNRERMIGRGMDAGTMPYNPSFDYDKKPAPSKRRHFISDELRQVKHVVENSTMHDYLEVEGTRNPNKIHLKSGDLVVSVVNDYGLFKFEVVQPSNWRGWKMECYSVDNEIDNVLYELGEYINEKEGNI